MGRGRGGDILSVRISILNQNKDKKKITMEKMRSWQATGLIDQRCLGDLCCC